MSIIGRIFGSDAAISKSIEVVAKGFDALVYTEEEKATDAAKTITEGRRLLVQWMDASQGQRLSRRVIAIAITFVWLLMYVIGSILSVFAIWTDSPELLRESAQTLGNYTESMTGAMMLILGFYFAGPHLADIVKPAMDKFSKRPDKDG